jgi:hypothetical protein
MIKQPKYGWMEQSDYEGGKNQEKGLSMKAELTLPPELVKEIANEVKCTVSERINTLIYRHSLGTEDK